MKVNVKTNTKLKFNPLRVVHTVCHVVLTPFFPGIKYDAVKEEKQLQEARQRELQRIEETKLKAAEKGQGLSLILNVRRKYQFNKYTCHHRPCCSLL